LTNRKDIQDEAKKIAVTDSTLRKNLSIPDEVTSREVVGKPRLIGHKPKKVQNNEEL
jgi:hypothetical protein